MRKIGFIKAVLLCKKYPNLDLAGRDALRRRLAGLRGDAPAPDDPT